MAKPEVTIIILTWNALPYTKICLESLHRYPSMNYQLVIVDNGSTDGTVEYLQRESEELNVKIIFNNHNVGYGKGIAQAYQHVNTRLVCLLNNDVVLSPGWLEGMVEEIDSDPLIAMVGPLRPAPFFRHPYATKGSKNVLETIKRQHENLNDPSELLLRFSFEIPFEAFVEDFKKANSDKNRLLEIPPEMISTCCALIDNKALEKAGGIVDTQFEMYGLDDTDLSWRLAHAGFHLAITNRSYVHHFEHVGTTWNYMDREYYLSVNMTRFLKKWGETFWQYIKQCRNKGLSWEEIRAAYWLNEKLLDHVEKSGLPAYLRDGK